MSTLVFLDDEGGALASLAASIAVAAGVSAEAESASPRPPSGEVRKALEEIGVARVVEARAPRPRSNGEIVVTIGRGAAGIDAHLYDGPARTDFGDASLERLALARIARDRIERWLEREGYSGSQSFA